MYFFSKGSLKPANKQYSNIPNDYEMTLNNDSVIQECNEDVQDVPKVKYNFIPISQIAETPPNDIVGKFGFNGLIRIEMELLCGSIRQKKTIFS